MAKPTRTWVEHERIVARKTGGKRKLDKGKHTEAEDVEHPLLSFEVKHGAHLPSIYVTMTQARKNAPTGKIPVGVHHRHGDSRYYAIIDLDDLMKFVNGGSHDGSEGADTTDV